LAEVEGGASGTGSRFDLLKSELERFVEVASTEFGADRVIVFGSLARALGGEGGGALGDWSDLDLVVVAETDRPFYERVKRLIRRVEPRVGADVLVYTPSEWERMSSERPFVREELLGRGRVVYERAG